MLGPSLNGSHAWLLLVSIDNPNSWHQLAPKALPLCLITTTRSCGTWVLAPQKHLVFLSFQSFRTTGAKMESAPSLQVPVHSVIATRSTFKDCCVGCDPMRLPQCHADVPPGLLCKGTGNDDVVDCFRLLVAKKANLVGLEPMSASLIGHPLPSM